MPSTRRWPGSWPSPWTTSKIGRPRSPATLLRHAAAGEFAERLHTLLAALLGPDDGTISTAIDRATAWGATSGTDSLVGVLIGLDVAAGVRGALH